MTICTVALLKKLQCILLGLALNPATNQTATPQQSLSACDKIIAYTQSLALFAVGSASATCATINLMDVYKDNSMGKMQCYKHVAESAVWGTITITSLVVGIHKMVKTLNSSTTQTDTTPTVEQGPQENTQASQEFKDR